MTKHTPGPWTLFDLSEDNDPQKEKPCRYWSIVRMGPLAYLKTDWDEIGEANARLIAAAPDMLKALKDAEHLLRKAGQGAGSIKKDFDKHLCLASASRIAEIIDKAEGRE